MLRKSLISSRSADSFNTSSMSFNGTDEYILTGYKGEVNVGASLSIWIKMKDFIGEQTMGSGSNERFYLGFNGTNLAFGVADSSKNSTDVSSYVKVNKWHHLVLVADCGASKVYIDGIERDTMSYTEDASSNPVDGFVIGARNSSDSSATINQSPMNCLINEVAIYCGDLTAAEVKNIYANGGGYRHSGSELDVWYRMGDAGDTQYVIDDGDYLLQGVAAPEWDADASVASGGTVHGWEKTNVSNVLTNTSNKYRIGYGSGGDKHGAKVILSDAKDLSRNLSINHLYKITLTAQRTGIFAGDSTTVIRVISGHSTSPLTTYAVEGIVDIVERTRTIYFIAESETTAELGPTEIKAVNESVDIDNIAIYQYSGYKGLTMNMGSENFVKDSP